MKWLSISMCVVMTLLAAGCSASVTPTSASVPATMSSIPTLTALPPSATPSPTQTRTPPPPTLTPLPILREPEEIKTKLFELLQNNGGCQLPCLFGYTPGIVSPQEMKNFFNQFANIDSPDMIIDKIKADDGNSLSFYIRYADNYLNLGISTYENKNQIQALAMDAFPEPKWNSHYAEIMNYYLLPQILTNYGEPSEVIILTYRNDRQRPDVTSFPFFLVILYPEQGFYAKYEMERVTSSANFLGCPSKSFVSVVTWPAGNGEIFQTTVQPTINGEYLSDYKSLADATSMTIEEFYQMFSNPNNRECIRTPIETWPEP